MNVWAVMSVEFFYCLNHNDEYREIAIRYFRTVTNNVCVVYADRHCFIEANDTSQDYPYMQDVLLLKGEVTNAEEVNEMFCSTYNTPDPCFQTFEKQLAAYEGDFATVFYNTDAKYMIAYAKGNVPLYYAMNCKNDILAISTLQHLLVELPGVFKVLPFPRNMYWNGYKKELSYVSKVLLNRPKRVFGRCVRTMRL